MAKIEFNKEFKQHKVSVVEGDSICTYRVVDMFSDSLEYENGVLKIDDALKKYDLKTGGIHFIYNLDMPSKVEAENLKNLRRSVALKNVFAFDRGKKFDLIGFMPWLIIILLVLFHK